MNRMQMGGKMKQLDRVIVFIKQFVYFSSILVSIHSIIDSLIDRFTAFVKIMSWSTFAIKLSYNINFIHTQNK